MSKVKNNTNFLFKKEQCLRNFHKSEANFLSYTTTNVLLLLLLLLIVILINCIL